MSWREIRTRTGASVLQSRFGAPGSASALCELACGGDLAHPERADLIRWGAPLKLCLAGVFRGHRKHRCPHHGRMERWGTESHWTARRRERLGILPTVRVRPQTTSPPKPSLDGHPMESMRVFGWASPASRTRTRLSTSALQSRLMDNSYGHNDAIRICRFDLYILHVV